MLMSDLLSHLSTDELFEIYGASECPDGDLLDIPDEEFSEDDKLIMQENLEHFYEMVAYMGDTDKIPPAAKAAVAAYSF